MKEPIIKHFIRGGQILFHSIRMFIQIAKPLLVLGLILFSFWQGYYLYRQTTVTERYLGQKWLYASLLSAFNEQSLIYIKMPSGETTSLPAGTFKQLAQVQQVVLHFKQVLIRSLWINTLPFLLLMIAVTGWLIYRGKKHTTNKLIKGDGLKSPQAVKRLIIKNHQAADISLSKIKMPLIKGSECAHLFVVGTTGTGKSTLIKE